MRTAITISTIIALLLPTQGATSTTTEAKQEIRRLFGSQARLAECIVRHESGWNPRAINWNDKHRNGPGSFGLFQIGRLWIVHTNNSWHKLLDPVTNVRVAHRVYRTQGWNAWSTYRYCR